MDGQGEAAIADFGLSRSLVDLSGLTTVHVRSEGNPSRFEPPTHGETCQCDSPFRSLSPEILDGDDATPASDVYAFGCFVLETMSSQRPFYQLGNRNNEIMKAITAGLRPMPVDHSQIPSGSELWPLMRRCWMPDPKSRPIMNDLLIDLRRLQRPDARSL